MFDRFGTASVARASASHPWRTVLAWVVVLAASVALVATLFADGVTSAFTFTSKPEAQRGADLIEKLRGVPASTNEVIVVQSATLTVDDAEFERFVGQLRLELGELEGDAIRPGTVLNYYDAHVPALVSQDRRATILPFAMAGTFDDAQRNIDKVIAVVDSRSSQPAFDVMITGQATIGKDFEKLAEDGLATGEAFGMPVALIILVLVCGALIAAALPIIVAVVAILVALGVAALVGQVFALSFFVQNVVFMIGLAVGIDYSLFIIARYREERERGRDKLEAIGRTGNTATRAVLFSGMTVVLALMGMLMVPFNVFIGLGIGAILVVVASVLAAMTLLPAVLSLLGDRINWLTIPWVGRLQAKHDETRTGGFWDRASRTVMRAPVLSLILAGGFLIAATVPVLDLATGFAGVSSMPDDVRSRRAFDIIDEKFSAGTVTPAQIAIDGPINSPQVQDAINKLVALMDKDPEGSFDTPQPIEVSEDGGSALLTVPVAGDSAEGEAKQAILRLRQEYVPAAFASAPGVNVYVTGETAFNIDFFTASNGAVRYVFPFVLGMSLILLMIVFRSVVVPIKAIILNMLSVGATYGILVLIFIKGWGADAVGLTRYPVIEAWIPLFLFTILFGLSMDYHVFLLSRIRERYDQTHDNTESVAFGIRTTGRLITGAALIMVAVFWAFAAGDLVGLQQMGVGLGVAVLLDATIVRMILVPASMKLLGNANWYLPKFLNWLPDFRVEAPQQPDAARPAGVPAGGANGKAK